MRMANYEFAEELDKIEWLNSIQMKVGLPYFGGKSVIGRYLFNNIFNLSVEMKKQGRTPEIFIDAFTGGGKIGLSVPDGWYDTIVINDLDYGVYSYYKCCKDNYIALINMIEKIGDIMSADVFYLAAYIRRFGLNVDKWNDNENVDIVKEDEVLDPLAAAALTYWVTSAAFNCMAAMDSTSYNLIKVKLDQDGNPQEDDKNNDNSYKSKKEEQENIKKVIARAKKNIPKLHEQLNKRDYRIENLDYRELIKKYNGKSYEDLQGNIHDPDISLAGKNKLWYFDPPYHPDCLYAGEDAPYAETFTKTLANEMVDILAGEKEDEVGTLEYFIKSDYDPQYILTIARRDVNVEAVSKQRRDWYKDLIKREDHDNKHEISKIMAKLEVSPFCKICVGGFDKGSIQADHKKGVGMEYIWCRGFPEGYSQIEGVAAKE